MFTGIIETTTTIFALETEGTNLNLTFSKPNDWDIKIDQSIAHNGVCLTVVALDEVSYTLTAVQETLLKTSLGTWKVGDSVNLERCMPANSRFDGHIVQGHVDQVGTIDSITDENGSWLVKFSYSPTSQNIVVEKGSICINGVSLTAFNAEEDSFMVTIIPYTWEHTNFSNLVAGDKVNLEFDIIGKYVARLLGR
jgi:riboflavin synthase